MDDLGILQEKKTSCTVASAVYPPTAPRYRVFGHMTTDAMPSLDLLGRGFPRCFRSEKKDSTTSLT